MTVYGYIRYKSKDNIQKMNGEKEKLEKFGAQRFFVDCLEDQDTNPLELIKLVNEIGKDDIFMVCDAEEIGGLTYSFLDFKEMLDNKGVILDVLNLGRMDDSLAGGILSEMIVAWIEKNGAMKSEAIAEGMDIAKAMGKMIGRKPRELEGFAKIVEKVEAKKITVNKACEILGITKPTYYARKRKLDKFKKE